MKLILSFITLTLLAVSPARGESVDSLKICMQAGDSCMREFNTFEALKYFRQAYKMVDNRDVRLKLADCYYKRATAELSVFGCTDSAQHNCGEDQCYDRHRRDE